MKKYKTIKLTRSKWVSEEYEEKVPVWWYRFLLWLFDYEEDRLARILRDERKHAWDNAYAVASKKAHSTKAVAMENKLRELGFEVICDFPMARILNPDSLPDKPVDPTKAWRIVKIK